jgi:methyl-accepting chemotaxis protein
MNKTHQGASALALFSSISFKLKFMVVFIFLSFLLLGYRGYSGMTSSRNVIHKMYSEGMQHTVRAGKILSHLDHMRSSLLLAFQHDEASGFADLHDHPVSLHIKAAEDAISALHAIVDDEILPSELNSSERKLVESLASKLDEITEHGFKPAITYLLEDNYYESNKVLLKVINPKFKEVMAFSEAFLKMQNDEAKESVVKAEENTKSLMIITGITTSVSLLIIGFLSTFIIKRIILASSKLDEVSDKIASGDLTQRIKIGGSDEFSHIAKYVNKIVDNFQSVVQGNLSSTEQIACAADESSAVATQTKTNIVEQQDQTQLIATAIHEFTSTVHEVARSASCAATASEEADQASKNGQSVVQESIEMIMKLSDEMQESVRAMKDLAIHAEEIGSVVEVIQGISEQTNLLALNAAIEAARAGEQGRGFAVVADEVRTLASRTQQSTGEIQQTIQQLQSGTQDIVKRLGKGAESASNTAEKALEAEQALAIITASVEKITEMNTAIATAAEEQGAVTEEINKNINAISDISNETAAGAEQSTSATLELARLAETLKKEVAAYIV